jgi:hypothetical protein
LTIQDLYGKYLSELNQVYAYIFQNRSPQAETPSLENKNLKCRMQNLAAYSQWVTKGKQGTVSLEGRTYSIFFSLLHATGVKIKYHDKAHFCTLCDKTAILKAELRELLTRQRKLASTDVVNQRELVTLIEAKNAQIKKMTNICTRAAHNAH